MTPDALRNRLYLDDAFADACDARVIAKGLFEGRHSLILDQSVFYPEAGGQLFDIGFIAEEAVVAVQLDAQGRVHHVLEKESALEIGETVNCSIDAKRRRQHRALHTGQHIFSRALEQSIGAETLSARLGESTCTIDTDRVLSATQVEQALALAQSVVDDDREVRAYFPDESALRQLSLRRAPKVKAHIRVVDIEGFDQTPCGGTHVSRTSQVQLLCVTQLEKRKQGTRIHFECEERARQFLFEQKRVVGELASHFTCGPADIYAAVLKNRADLKQLRDANASLNARELERRVDSLDNASDDATIVFVENEGDAKSLNALATRLARQKRFVVLALGAPQAQVVVARGEDSNIDCSLFLKTLCQRLDGRGGGKKERAQGRVATAGLRVAIDEILQDYSKS